MVTPILTLDGKWNYLFVCWLYTGDDTDLIHKPHPPLSSPGVESGTKENRRVCAIDGTRKSSSGNESRGRRAVRREIQLHSVYRVTGDGKVGPSVGGKVGLEARNGYRYVVHPKFSVRAGWPNTGAAILLFLSAWRGRRRAG